MGWKQIQRKYGVQHRRNTPTTIASLFLHFADIADKHKFCVLNLFGLFLSCKENPQIDMKHYDDRDVKSKYTGKCM